MRAATSTRPTSWPPAKTVTLAPPANPDTSAIGVTRRRPTPAGRRPSRHRPRGRVVQGEIPAAVDGPAVTVPGAALSRARYPRRRHGYRNHLVIYVLPPNAAR